MTDRISLTISFASIEQADAAYAAIVDAAMDREDDGNEGNPASEALYALASEIKRALQRLCAA